MQSSIPSWVPEAARRRITELRASPQGMDGLGRALLDRLSGYQTMKTDVWPKLPPGPKGIEASIVDWSFAAFIIFLNLPRPYPKTAAGWRKWAKHIQKHPPSKEPIDVSWKAFSLWEDIFKLKSDTEFYWPLLWEGDKSFTPDAALIMLDQLRRFYVRMDEVYRTLLALLPTVKRWTPKGAQKFFTEFLSDRMKQIYGQPLDAVVAALAEVAFDLPQGVAEETIRGRRRSGRPPENSKRKSC